MIIRLYIAIILLISCNGKNNNESKDKNVTIRRTYYPSGKLKSEKQYYLLFRDGLSKEYYENGKLSNITSYKDGLRNGIFILFYDNGSVEGVGFYKNDKRDSIWSSYEKNGKIKRVINFEDDKKFKSQIDYFSDSKVIEQYTFYDYKGEPIYISNYDKTGNLIKEWGHIVPIYGASDYNVKKGDTLIAQIYVVTPTHYKPPIVLSKMEPVSTTWDTLQIVDNCATYFKINTSNQKCIWFTKVIVNNVQTDKDSVIESSVVLDIDK